MLSLVTGVLWIAVRPDILASYHYGPHVLAVTHLFTLGWITTIIMGAMYQLVPVALRPTSTANGWHAGNFWRTWRVS